MEKIPAFRRTEFEAYLQTLRSACTKGNGSIALTAKHDPITSHLNDPFVKAKIDSLRITDRRRFLAAVPSEDAILRQPNLVEDTLPHLVNFKAFSYIVPNGERDSPQHFRADYLALKAACTQWTQSEAAVYRVCLYSLKLSNELEINPDRTSEHFAGRYLLQKIKEAGANYSDKAASELVKRLVTNSMLPTETVTKYHVRHTGILKSLTRRGLSAE